MLTKYFSFFSKPFFGEGFFSDSFCNAMEQKLQDDLFHKTGIRDKNENILLSVNSDCAYICEEEVESGNYRVVQTLKLDLNVRNVSHTVWVVWYGKKWNAKAIRPFFEMVNPDDIDMIFKELPVERILEHYYEQPPQLSFDLSHYKFNIEMGHFFIDSMYLKIKGKAERFEEIEKLLDIRIQAWNMESEKNKCDKGVFHNSRIESKDEEFIIYYMDLGSAGEEGIRYLLDGLNEILGVDSVEITSFI